MLAYMYLPTDLNLQQPISIYVDTSTIPAAVYDDTAAEKPGVPPTADQRLPQRQHYTSTAVTSMPNGDISRWAGRASEHSCLILRSSCMHLPCASLYCQSISMASPMPSCPSYEQLVKRWKLYEVNVPKKGRGVFAGTSIPPQQLVLKFDGPLFERETCPNFEESIQVGFNCWMWSSGGLDDLVNHSCNPNTGLHQTADGSLYLRSLRYIAKGEELLFDYSTCAFNDPVVMECACGEPSCRGVISNFLDMPGETQARYISMGVVPMHVKIAYAAAHGLLSCKPALLVVTQPCTTEASPPPTPAIPMSDSASSLSVLSDE